MLAGCGTNRAASVEHGEGRAFKAPPHVILGKTAADQRWIDETVEVGVEAFEWPRPGPRPPELDRPPAPAPKAVPTSQRDVPTPKARLPPRPKWIDMFKRRGEV